MTKRTVAHEQIYTASALAARCMERVREQIDLASFEVLLEPCAGTGAFFDLLPPDRRIGIDIDPRSSGIEQADFRTWEPPPTRGPILTVGNPPFGQRGALAVEFLNRACEFSEVVAFILPRSFQKYTFQDRVHPSFHLVDAMACDEFVDADEQPTRVNAVFQIWERRPTLRRAVAPAASHPDFDMCHRHLSRTTPEDLARIREEYAFSIPQVGSSFSPRDPAATTRGSHWFIKPKVPGVRERFERLDFCFLDGMNTAHTSLSKRDIIRAYQAVVDDTVIDEAAVVDAE